MRDFEPEIQMSVATGVSGVFVVLLFGNTDFDLCPPLLEKGDNDIIQTVIVERKITDILPGSRFQEETVSCDGCRIQGSSDGKPGGRQRQLQHGRNMINICIFSERRFDQKLQCCGGIDELLGQKISKLCLYFVASRETGPAVTGLFCLFQNLFAAFKNAFEEQRKIFFGFPDKSA